jgi:hypothetical protein
MQRFAEACRGVTARFQEVSCRVRELETSLRDCGKTREADRVRQVQELERVHLE